MAKSESLAPIQLYFNDRKDDTQLNSFLLKPNDSLVLLKYQGSLPDSIFKNQVKDSLRISYYLGHSSLIEPDLNYAYRLPFKKGKKYEVSQSFNGKKTHNDEKSRYAIDFQLNVGEPVHAARGGLVVKVVDWFTNKVEKNSEMPQIK